MPQTKTKRRSKNEDEDDDLPEPAAPTVAVVERGPETMHDREHIGHEVASDLTLGGMTTFLSVMARGVNLVAGNAALSAFVPVRIVSRETEGRLELKSDDAKALAESDGVAAFLIGDEDDRTRYYIPIAEFLARAELREGRQTVEFDPTWLRPFAGHAGVKRAFARLAR